MSKKIKKENRVERIIIGKPGFEEESENFNRLKDNILYLNADGKQKVIQIESSLSKEGKTTVATNLAVSIGLNHKKVVIIDCDLRLPKAHRAFELENNDGLSEYMLGEKNLDEIIKHINSYSVDLISCGKRVENPSLILSSEKFGDLIRELRTRYDFVIVDCPPILEVSDYILTSKYTDGVLFCVAYGKTKKIQVKESLHLLKQRNIPILGCVYTFVDKKMHHGSYNKYYSPSSYYSKVED